MDKFFGQEISKLNLMSQYRSWSKLFIILFSFPKKIMVGIFLKKKVQIYICPLYIVRYYIKWAKTAWTKKNVYI